MKHQQHKKHAKNRCSCCGKELTNPVSVSVGIGPVCRVAIKDANIGQESIFSARASFDYRIDGYVIAITDLDGGKSVTNDIENVIADIIKAEGINNVSVYKIMYRDTQKIWDGVAVLHGRVSFFPLNEMDYHAAKIKLLSQGSK